MGILRHEPLRNKDNPHTRGLHEIYARILQCGERQDNYSQVSGKVRRRELNGEMPELTEVKTIP